MQLLIGIIAAAVFFGVCVGGSYLMNKLVK